MLIYTAIVHSFSLNPIISSKCLKSEFLFLSLARGHRDNLKMEKCIWPQVSILSTREI